MDVKILTNKIQCKLCSDIIESTHVHEYKKCACGACGVDGVREYLKRIGNPATILELSQTEIIKIKKIKRNIIMCRLCSDTIESTHVHEYKKCACGACGVDGGREYLRRLGYQSSYVELSEYE